MLAQSVVAPSAAGLRKTAPFLGNGRSLAGQMGCHMPFQRRSAGFRKRTAVRVSAALAIPSTGAKRPGTDLETIPAVDLPILTEVLMLRSTQQMQSVLIGDAI